MCGRFSLYSDLQTVMERFGIDEVTFDAEEYEASYNTAPSQRVAAVISDGKQRRLGFLRWGLIPPWAKDAKIGYKMINARAETAAEKPSYRNAFRKKRCLIVADSFFEWRKTDGSRQPMLIRMKTGEPFAFAGLWESWTSSEGETLHTCTILTTEPNELMAEIHDRMPVVLSKEDEARWLDPSIQDEDVLKDMLRPYDASRMEAYEVSPAVNSPKNNGPDLIKKAG